jgi:hypothetical protein
VCTVRDCTLVFERCWCACELRERGGGGGDINVIHFMIFEEKIAPFNMISNNMILKKRKKKY